MTTDEALDAIRVVERAQTPADLGVKADDALPPAARAPGIPEMWRQWARLHGRGTQ